MIVVMNSIYNRIREPDTYQCGACRTTWKEFWIEGYGREKHEIECPFCYTWFDESQAEVIKLTNLRRKNENIANLLRKKAETELKLDFVGEAAKKRTYLLLKLLDIDEELRSLVDMTECMGFPTTCSQDCLTQGSTIRPQIDWVEFDLAMEAKGIKINEM